MQKRTSAPRGISVSRKISNITGVVRIFALPVAVIVLLGLGGLLFGQAGFGLITGTVVDQSHGSIAGAHVTLVQLSTKTRREIVTNAEGVFNLSSIVPGEYTLTFAASGFREKTLEKLVINGFQELSLGEVGLEVGAGPVTAVTVTAEQQLVKDSGVRADTIQAKQVDAMPIDGGNWGTLLKIIRVRLL